MKKYCTPITQVIEVSTHLMNSVSFSSTEVSGAYAEGRDNNDMWDDED